MTARFVAVAALFATASFAAPVQKPVTYALGPKLEAEGVLLFDDAVKTPRPALLVVPNWLGVTPANVKQAQELAGTRYVVFLADVYGKASRPKDQGEAGKASGALKGDRALLRERVTKSLEAFKAAAKGTPADVTRLGAAGFCFGGTAVLELARTGAAVAGVVSIHGGLDSPKPEDGKRITAKVLALHGADDPFVPAEDVAAFEAELRAAKVDWEVVRYGNAVHSFTDVDAAMPGKAQYNAGVARRAYARLHGFFDDAFAAPAR